MATPIKVDSLESYFPSKSQTYGQRDGRNMPLDLSRVGPLLKEARTEKGLSLDDVSEILFIRKSALEAIESGYWDRLPHMVYVKGYVKLYASYLDICDKMEDPVVAETSAVCCQASVASSDNGQLSRAAGSGRVKRFGRKLLLICTSLIVLTAAFLIIPGYHSRSSATRLREVSMGFYNADHSITDVRKLQIPYSERPWLNPFATTGETRTMILDLPETNPMTHNNNPPTDLTDSEG